MTDDRPSPRPRAAAAPAGDARPAPTPGTEGTSTGGFALTSAELVAMTGGELVLASSRPIRGAAVDSRLVQPGQLFAALPGERTDGHRFLGDAVRAGAAALLVTRPVAATELAAFGDVTVVRVPDALRGLGAIAAGWRARFDLLVVGVTGSIAKTSTKEAVATVLAADRRTLRSEGNQNNEIGLPLTILRLGPEDEAAVLEMGMYVGGEIRDLVRIARPRIGVVTAVLGVHLSRIGTIDAVEDAKAELVEALPADGVAVLNADDPRVRRMASRTPARVETYGFSPEASVGAEDVVSAGLDGMRFTLRLPPAAPGGPVRRVPAGIPSLGRLSVHNALAGAAVGLAAGMTPDAIAAALGRGWSAPHRGQVVRAGGVTIVDDAYNASPASVLAALELLAGLPGRRVAVLGEMLELGEAADAGHREVGRAAAAVCDLLCVVGPGAAGIARGAGEGGLAAGRLIEAADPAAATERLVDVLEAGDVVLVKASRGVALEVLVDALVVALGERSAHGRGR
ncbi:MAG TPA: UDP-N-acetylmuramoyl-tripeptide--D-alanyl-D-alanine ligase [Candidatus Limnocylindrales bacterium]|nr:UDP-N-acetylmuramoyl-tripeptide--D-alanyl-D-alanine ligase [Candidatus Limnocylindrales bacterium]